jgi:ABC-2 type transport system permease protein
MPHAWIVIAKIISASAVAMLQALLLLALLAAIGYAGPGLDWRLLPLALLATALVCAASGMLIASFTRTLDNFAGVMNFVIFPVFFLSGSLYPVRNLPALLQGLARVNPYTYGVDLLKHALLPQFAMNADFSASLDLIVLAGATALAAAIASWRFSQEPAYEPMIHALTRGPQ